ncbi:uncharacterized protein LOC121431465 [Lytechinus variegatus]|uniref:uncharacterized protein LOC121431465 n=1 Tax=Lytechinus variegatus TaxID=7654 RepID=UPI001BB2B12F|nr:uncharacterized protein LOC121431465 [Lytechinus variegatus]
MALFGLWRNGVVAFLLLQSIVFVSNWTYAVLVHHDLCNDTSTANQTSSKYMDYLGCYNSACFETVRTSNVTDIDECTSRCKDGNSSFSALSLGYLCSCGNFTCRRKKLMCDRKCGIPCFGNANNDVFRTCGGQEFYQIYNGTSLETPPGSTLTGHIIQTTAIVCGVIVVTTCFVCFFVSISERRRKRRHAREQADSSIPTEITSQPQRPRSVNNIYSIAGPSRHHLDNTSNGYSVSELMLSSEDTYDHTVSSDRIQSRRGNRHGSHSLPRGLQPGSAHPMRNPTGMQNVTEDRGKYQGGGSITEFCCSDRKHGVQCSCSKRRRQGGSDQRTPGAYSNRRVGSAKWSDKRPYGADGGVSDSRGRWPREVAPEPRKPSVGEAGRGPRRDAHLQKSLKSRKEMSSSCKERGMLALPGERDTVGNNNEGRSNQRPPPQSDDNPPPIIHRGEKPEVVENDDMPGEYHTLEPEQVEQAVGDINEGQQSSSSEYFVLEPSEYSIEQSDPCSAVKANGHQGSKDTATCSWSSDPQYDYAAIPGQSNLRFLPCTFKHTQAHRSEVGGNNVMIDNILYDPS